MNCLSRQKHILQTVAQNCLNSSKASIKITKMQEYCSNQNIIPNFTRKNDYFVNKRESSKYETKQKKITFLV